jgi:hypothetical protein
MGARYTEERAWADKFIPRQKRILGRFTGTDPSRIITASDDDDQKHGIDVLCIDIGKRIGLRVRRAGNRKDQFTVRIKRSSVDGRNELDKIKGNELDYMLYCHATPNASRNDTPEDDGLEYVVLLDLAPLRAAASDRFALVRHDMPPADDPFLAFAIDDLQQYGPTVLASLEVKTHPTFKGFGLGQ